MKNLIMLLLTTLTLTGCAGFPDINIVSEANKKSRLNMFIYKPEARIINAVGGEGNVSKFVTRTDEQTIINNMTCKLGKPGTGRFHWEGTELKYATGKDCNVDLTVIKTYLDKAIIQNAVKAGQEAEKRKIRAVEYATQERERAKRSPIVPFVVGCEDYKRSFRGEKLLTVNHAFKVSKLSQTYIVNLYNKGYEHAKYSGRLNIDCQFLAYHIVGGY